MRERWKKLKAWQKKDFLLWFLLFIVICVSYVGFVVYTMNSERQSASDQFDAVMKQDNAEADALAQKFSGQATQVLCGTYVETLKDISLKDNNFRVVFSVWFKWEETKDRELDFIPADAFRIYNGTINKKETIKDYKKDGVRYQEMRLDTTVSKAYNTVRFPLGSYILNFYIEPKYTVDQVVLTPDVEKSGINSNLSISGYALTRHGVTDFTMKYPNTFGNPKFTEPQVNSEIMTCLEVNRNSWGLYMKCFIALLGTTAWVLLMVYICANHRVNPLGTIPSALFGTVSNIMVGANLVSDVDELGLVEYVNIFGIMILLAGAMSIIHMNCIRDVKIHSEDDKKQNEAYAHFFGRIIFYAILVCCILGQALMPISAYMWGYK